MNLKVQFPLMPYVARAEPCCSIREDLLLYLAVAGLLDWNGRDQGRQLVCRFEAGGTSTLRIYFSDTLTSCEWIETCQDLLVATGIHWHRFSYPEGNGVEAELREDEHDDYLFPCLSKEDELLLRWLTANRGDSPWDLWDPNPEVGQPIAEQVSITDDEVSIWFRYCVSQDLDSAVKILRAYARIPLGRIGANHHNLFAGQWDAFTFTFNRADLAKVL